MEVNEAAKIAIARPVASRPRCPIYKSFSELLAGAIDISSTNAHSEMAVTAIRPKTVKLKPATNHALVGELSSQRKKLVLQVGMSEAPVGCRSDNILQMVETPKVLYKPMAKLAPRKTIPLLENKGSSASDPQRETAEAEARVQSENEVKQQNDLTIGSQQSLLAKSRKNKRIADSTIVSESTEEVAQSLINTSNVDRPSYDGYNWRKYGQKQVKGSEYPRSYYKCTHPKCPVKKKVERSYDGQIAEIVYRGEHNHPKPQPPKGRAAVCNDSSKETNKSAWTNQHPQTSEAYVCRIENQNDVGLTIRSAYSGKTPCLYDPVEAAGMHAAARKSEDSAEGSKKLEATCDEPKTKRRKIEGQLSGAGTSGESAVPSMPNRNTTDSDITEDGFRWRKYGQKVVKGSSYPRSYYRCTSPKCSVRKFVERTTDDPKAFITTYEGKHNHGVPNRRTDSEASKTSSKSSAMKVKS